MRFGTTLLGSCEIPPQVAASLVFGAVLASTACGGTTNETGSAPGAGGYPAAASAGAGTSAGTPGDVSAAGGQANLSDPSVAGAGTSAASTGSVGAAGGGQAETEYRRCDLLAYYFHTPLHYSVRHITEAGSRTWVDECDEDGNLIEYDCVSNCANNPFGPCDNGLSGSVAPRNIDCQGRCVDGACPRTCVVDENLTVLQVNPDGTARFGTDRNLELDCELIFDRSDDGYDCSTSPRVQSVVQSPHFDYPLNCTTTEDVRVLFDDPAGGDSPYHECAYDCTAAFV